MTMSEQQELSGIPEKEERNWGALCHVVALTGYILPFASLLGPLIVWMIKKDDMPFVDDQGKEALNFQLTVFLGFIICGILMFVFIGFFLFAVLAIYQIIAIILAAIKASEGVYYRYPYVLRLIK